MYRLFQSAPLSAGEGLEEESDEIGLAFLDCEECDEEQKADLGCWRFGNRLKASHWISIDYTGTLTHDRVNFCPRSCLDDDHTQEGQPLASDILSAMQKAKKVRAFGGPDRFEGESASDLAPRYAWFWATLEGVISRYTSECRDAQARLNRKVTSAIHRRLSHSAGVE